MKTNFRLAISIAFAFTVTAAFPGIARTAGSTGSQQEEAVSPKIAWYSTLESGLAEAERSKRPILFVSAAPQCLGVSGIW